MAQTNLKIEEAQIEFQNHYSQYGFKDKNDLDLQALTEAALLDLPE